MTRLPTLIDKARRSLAIAKTTDEVLKIRDEAKRLQRAAKALNAAKDAQDRCGEIVVYAERKLGDLIRRQKETVGLGRAGRPKKISSQEEPISAPPTLADAGIDRKTSARAQKLAALSEQETTAAINLVAETGPVTPQRVLRHITDAAEAPSKPTSTITGADLHEAATRNMLSYLRDFASRASYGGAEPATIAKLICDERDERTKRDYLNGLAYASEIFEAVKLEQARRDAAEKEWAKERPPYLKPV